MNPLPSATELLAKLRTSGLSVPEGPARVDSFGDSPELSEHLLDLIVSGKKRAGTSLLWALESDGEALPIVGQIEIVVDHNGEPVAVTEIGSVAVLPFSGVAAEYAAIEGEGDGSLEYWREVHWTFFQRECARIGREPSEGMPVVCTTFEVLALVPRAAP